MNRFVKQNLLLITVMSVSSVIILALLIYSAIVYIQMSRCISETEELRTKISQLIRNTPAPVDGNKPLISQDIALYSKLNGELSQTIGRPYQHAAERFIEILKEVKKGESIVINVHIPRTGTPMDKESCDKSYAMAREFFKNATGNDYVFVCHSWLLFPQNKEILPSHTNVYRFMSEYDIVDWGYNEGNDLWRLFDTQEMNPDRLPTNGSLRRAYVEHLKNGKRVGWGYGVKK